MTTKSTAEQMELLHLPAADLNHLNGNPRKIADHNAVQKLEKQIREHGFQNPLNVYKEDDGRYTILCGNHRYQAGKRLGMELFPCVEYKGTREQALARAIADNKSSMWTEWDYPLLQDMLKDLDVDGFDMELTGFDAEELAELFETSLNSIEADTTNAPSSTLAEQFVAPPFTVLDTRQGYWQERRRAWLQITGDLTETKEKVLSGGDDTLLTSINDGSSNFDPVLAEIMMSWFCPAGGKVLDPFGGEQTKGVVAGELGLTYRAVEFRQDQVNVNRNACKKYSGVDYVCGDSENIGSLINDTGFDLCFTSPPYYDLEVYSKDDMSALGTYKEFMAKYERIFEQCVAMLRGDSFLVIKIGEIRDKKTGIYRNFVGDNIAMFKRLGLAYYNELVLLNIFGTAPQRAGRSFNNRKMVKVHQNVLVFAKGSPNKAAEKCGDLRCMLFEDSDAAAAL